MAVWRRRSLPRAGGTDDQDALTLQALEYLQDEMNAVIASSRPPHRERRPTKN
jgi:hypothetical protein